MVIRAENLSKQYTQGELCVKALKPCSFTIRNGEQIAIIGTSGSGKSTLLHLIGGLEQATEGSIKYDDADLTKMDRDQRDDFRLKNIGVVFQSFNLIPELTSYENIILPIMLQNKKIDRNYANQIITRLNLSDRLDHLPGQLSGGQQQRVAMARALITRPGVLLCDEPTGNLDKKNTDIVVKLLFDAAKEFASTLIVVTHDVNIAKQFTRVITINDGFLEEIYEEVCSM